MNELEIKYQEHDLDKVMRYFAAGFKPKDGHKILRYEFFIDTHRRKVVFKLVVEPPVVLTNATQHHT